MQIFALGLGKERRLRQQSREKGTNKNLGTQPVQARGGGENEGEQWRFVGVAALHCKQVALELAFAEVRKWGRECRGRTSRRSCNSSKECLAVYSASELCKKASTRRRK